MQQKPWIGGSSKIDPLHIKQFKHVINMYNQVLDLNDENSVNFITDPLCQIVMNSLDRDNINLTPYESLLIAYNKAFNTNLIQRDIK